MTGYSHGDELNELDGEEHSYQSCKREIMMSKIKDVGEDKLIGKSPKEISVLLGDFDYNYIWRHRDLFNSFSLK